MRRRRVTVSVCYGYFLGTGSIPTAERNSQSILLELPETKILVDCGEGTQRQILRLGKSWDRLSGVFLTHHHVDHIYGIGGLIYGALLHTGLDTLKIYGPSPALQKARSLADTVDSGFRDRLEWIELTARDTIKSEHFECVCFNTFHSGESLGYAFQIGRGKMSFLGDVASPNESALESIISFVMGSDVLVSDAAHITEVEAAAIARTAEVKTLYLVPVSYDFPEAEILQRARKIFPNVYIPNDLDRFVIKL